MYNTMLQEVALFLKAFATIRAIKYFVWARTRIGWGRGSFLGRMRKAWVRQCFNVNGVWASGRRIASTCSGWLMHAQMPPKA